ncbi:hypothetical protein C0991_005848 [Blastosporella zonata]|nr:hypothetical protein C0991_005848 [Blastosporella zonata]
MRLLAVLLTTSVLSLSVYAHPAIPPFVSVPLLPVSTRDANAPSLPPTVVHQQHTNRALRRLDSMVRAPNPATDDYLLRNLVRTAAALPPHIQKRYYHPGLDYLTRLAAHYNHKSTKASTTGEPQSLAVEGVDVDGNGVTAAIKPTFKNTIGLEIQAQDIGYIGQIKIGTPLRVFNLLVDSGSADLWVGGEGCLPTDPFDDQADCGAHNFLGSSSSSTFHDTKSPWTIEYGTGTVSGNLTTDTVAFNGLTLRNHKFGVAYKESSEFIPDYIPFDGILGFANSTIARQSHTTPFLPSLVAAGKLTHPIASYHIPRLADGAANNHGELTLGALNTARYDPKTLVSVPNMSPFGFWEAPLQNVAAGPELTLLGFTNRTAIMDTGTTLIVAPQDDVAAMHALIPDAVYHEDVGYWVVPCVVPKGAKPVLALVIGGRTFTVDARDIPFLPVDEANPTGNCTSGITEGKVGGPLEWLVGDVFLKNVYMSTNEQTNKISFANLK